jgi:hypothetical protein
MSLPFARGLFRLDGVMQMSYDRDSSFLQLYYYFHAHTILNYHSLPESEIRGPCYSHAKWLRGVESVHHVVIHITFRGICQG